MTDSTAPGRYNNDGGISHSNTNISLGNVNTATSLGKNMGSYRDVAGIQHDNVSFSDLKGVYAGTNRSVSGYVTLDNTNYDSYVQHYTNFSIHSDTTIKWDWNQAQGGNYNSGKLPIVYQKNVTTGGYNYGCRTANMYLGVLFPGNIQITTQMWGNYTLTWGTFDGTERAIAMGYIEMKSVDSSYTTAYSDLLDYPVLNAYASQTYIGYGYVVGLANATFRTTTRTKLIGIWQKTDKTFKHAWFDTAPFSTGAALTATQVLSLDSGLTDYGVIYSHKNNQMTFGVNFTYDSYANCDNPGKNTAGAGYYVLLMYDIGLRNATNGSVLNKNKQNAITTASEDVTIFAT